MAEFVPMPKLGFDMKEGRLVKQIAHEGQTIKKGDIIAEVETDKATVEVEAYLGGVIAKWLVPEDTFVPIGTPMVVVTEPGEKFDASALPKSNEPPAASNEPKALTTQQSTISNLKSTTVPADKLRASPVAKRMAKEMGLDLSTIKGSGPEGRIVKRDLVGVAASGGAAKAASPTISASAVTVTAEDQKVPLTKLRQAITRRMVESKTTIPHFYVSNQINMSAVMDLRKQANALLSDAEKISVNDFILKAAALTLREFPNLNASFNGDHVVQHGHINMGIAVAVTGGLLTIVVRDAEVKSLKQIAGEAKAMASRAREGKVKPDDVSGSTFTVSNLGMYEVDSFVAIINPPEAAILAVGSAAEVPIVKNGQLTTGWQMKATISADHRVTDGAEAAQFMQALKKKLEEPLRLML